MATFKPKSSERIMMKCMNNKPDQSKWGDWAPDGGCKNEVLVGMDVAKVLCSACTQRTVNEPGDYRRDLK